jgi:beta propeller repeat protein
MVYDLSANTMRDLGIIGDIDGDRLVYARNQDGNMDIFMRDLVTDVETRITNYPGDQMAPRISGKNIVFSEVRSGGKPDLFYYRIPWRLE